MLSRGKAFTLIELLVVIGIIAVLALVVILIINPVEILNRTRDSTRLSDLNTLNTAVNLYNADKMGFIGTSSITYISIPDPSATSTAGTNCASLGMPALPSGWTYQCAASSTLRKTDGTGWIPANFKNASFGSPLGALPVDPVNQSSTGLYYTYTVSGSQYELTALMQSSKQRTQLETNPLLTMYPGVDALGTNLALSALYNPSGIAGYWKLDETAGTTAADSSGNGDNGTTVNSPNWVSGLINNAISLDTASSQYIQLPDASVLHPTDFTVAAWINISNVNNPGNGMVFSKPYGSGVDNSIEMWYYVGSEIVVDTGSSSCNMTVPASSNNWIHLVFTKTGGSGVFYKNGIATDSTNCLRAAQPYDSDPPMIGADKDNGTVFFYFPGTIDDVRLYDHALSAAEVLALYNAER